MICNGFSIVNDRKDGNTGMVYLLDIKNRLAAKAKDMSIASNQQSAISNHFVLFLLSLTIFCWCLFHHLTRYFFVLPTLRWPMCFEPLSAIERHFIFSSNHSSFLLSKGRL